MTRNLGRALPLACALTLAGSALMAGSGAALAGKALPTAAPADGPGYCQAYLAKTTYRHDWDLSANKGKWFYATVSLLAGGEPYATNINRDERIAKTSHLTVQGAVPGDAQSVTMSFQFYDRKGLPMGDPFTKIIQHPACA